MDGDRGRGSWRVLIYNRASADKTGQRVSVESQDAENRAWCAREDWHVVAAVSDSNRSASRYAKRQREGYQEVMAGLAEGRWGTIDALVLWESSRSERGLDGHLQLRALCERLGMKLAYKGRILDMNDGDDRFTAGLDALLDEREAERARERTKRSHEASVRDGRPRSGVPYGYMRRYEEGTRRILEQNRDPETAVVVESIVAAVLAGETLYAIAQRLNAQGVLTPHAQRVARKDQKLETAGWSSTMIRNLLSKRSLMGVRTHNGTVTGPGVWEAIVSPADWRAVQNLLADPNRARHHGGREARWLLSGIATCGVCGAWLRPMRNRGRMTYACFGVTPTSPKGHVVRAQQPLDAYVTVAVVSRLSRPDALNVFTPAQVSDGRSAALERELADARAQLVEYEASAGTPGGVSASAFARIEARLSVRIVELEARLSPPVVVVPALVRAAAGPDAAARWEQLDVVGRRLVVRTLLQVAVLPVVKRGARGFDPNLIRLEWRGA